MTKLIANLAKIKSIKWNPFDTEIGDNNYITETAVSCCGVLELGELNEGNFLKDLRVYSTDSEDDYWGEPLYERRPTMDEVLEEIRSAYKNKGMAVCYLLDTQHKGDFGKLLRYDKWKYHGSFWDPSTRNTLHHWSKVIHTSAPQPIPSKSVIKRKGK